jgi:hypothetical protein
MHKLVNGEVVQLTPDEEVEVRAAWAAADRAQEEAEKAQAVEAARQAALRDLDEERLAAAAAKPDASDTVLAYASLKASLSKP